MNDDKREDRNPLIIPKGREAKGLSGCPKCGGKEFSGRNIQGMVKWTCNLCKNVWHGGMPQTPEDPTIPRPPQNPMENPTVQFARNKHGEVVEVRKRVNLTQEYRKGLPEPTGEE